MLVFEYKQLVSALPKLWKKKQCYDLQYQLPVHCMSVGDILECKKPVRTTYAKLIINISAVYLKRYHEKFCNTVSLCSFEDYLKMFCIANRISIRVKLRSFQYRILLHKIFTNDTLYRWGLVCSENCSNCEVKQTLKHLLWDCPESAKLWCMLKCMLKAVIPADSSTRNFSYPIIITNKWPDTNKALDSIMLATKYYIFQKFCEGGCTNTKQLMICIREIKSMEVYNAHNQKHKQATIAKWDKVHL